MAARTPEQARGELSAHCDGVVAGSALMETVREAHEEAERDPVSEAGIFSRKLADALRPPAPKVKKRPGV